MDIHQGFELLKYLILECETFDLGTLKYLETKLIQSKDLETIFYSQTLSLINQIYQQLKKHKNPHKKCEHLLILALNSLILNIYSHKYSSVQMELNNSLSVSQSSFFSINQSSMINENQVSPIQQIFKKINQLVEFNKLNVQINRRILHGFIETIDYILTRQKIQKSSFYSNKKIVTNLTNFTKPSYHMHIQKVNQIIFSGKLNMIESLLQDNSQKLGFSLIRIYYAAMNYQLELSNRKCFNGILNGGGEIMIYNLYKLYISQFSRKSELFMNTKSALFQLIMASFYIEFLPTINNFAAIIKKICQKLQGNYEQFHSLCQNILKQELLIFITELPPILVYRLNILRIIINNYDKWKDPLIDSLSPVKMFFINKFLFNPNFIEFFYDQDTLEEIEVISNYIHECFYTESIKKYIENEQACKVIEQVSQTFQNLILFQSEIGQTESKIYFIDELILKYDYEQLFNGLERAKFSPKDETQFLMANIQKDIITSRTKRVNLGSQNSNNNEIKLSSSMKVLSYQQLNNVLPENEQGRKSSYTEFVNGMESGESKFSQFLRKKQQNSKIKQKKSSFQGFNTTKKSQLQQLSLRYKLSKF